MLFNLWFYYGESEYAVELTYRSDSAVGAIVKRGAHAVATVELPPATDWETQRLVVGQVLGDASAGRESRGVDGVRVSRWPGEGSLRIADLRLLDAEGNDRAVFTAGSAMTIVVRFQARRAGTFNLVPAITIYRSDGVLVSNHADVTHELTVDTGAVSEFALGLPEYQFPGDGRYLISVALFPVVVAPRPIRGIRLDGSKLRIRGHRERAF